MSLHLKICLAHPASHRDVPRCFSEPKYDNVSSWPLKVETIWKRTRSAILVKTKIPEQREERWRLFFYTAHYHTNWSVSTRPSHFTNLPLPTHFTILQLCIILLIVEDIPKMSILDYLISSSYIYHLTTFVKLSILNHHPLNISLSWKMGKISCCPGCNAQSLLFFFWVSFHQMQSHLCNIYLYKVSGEFQFEIILFVNTMDIVLHRIPFWLWKAQLDRNWWQCCRWSLMIV